METRVDVSIVEINKTIPYVGLLIVHFVSSESLAQYTTFFLVCQFNRKFQRFFVGRLRGLAEDTVLSFEVAEEMTEDELREKIKEVYSQDNQTETPTEDNTSTDGTTEDGEPAGAPAQTTETFSDNGEEPAAEPAAEPTNEEPLKFSVELTYEEKRRVLCV